MYIAKLLASREGIQTLIFSPISHSNSESTLVLNVLMCHCPKSLANHCLTRSHLTTLLTHSFWEQAFLVAILPRRAIPSSACLKGILVILNSKTFFLFFVFLFFISSIFFFLNETKKNKRQT